MVDDTQRKVLDMSTSTKPGPLDAGSGAMFERRGDTVVAGLACTDWETVGGGPPAVLCITADGALLRVQAGGQTLVEAVSVSYAPGDPTVFGVPAGYEHVTGPSK